MTLHQWEKKMFSKEHPGLEGAALEREWRDWLEYEEAGGRRDPVSGMHSRWVPYVGTVVAYEMCPRYKDAVRAGLEAEKRKRAKSEKPLGE